MINRRQLLKNAGLIALSAGLDFKSFAGNNTAKKRVLRFAHLTDVHVEPELNAPAGLAKCLQHLQSQTDKPAYNEWRRFNF